MYSAEILKSDWNSRKRPALCFCREFDQAGIDLLIEEDGVLYPVDNEEKCRPCDFAIFQLLSRHF